jgi:hypothetical protein
MEFEGPKRRTPRYPFIADATLTADSGSALSAQVKELSLYGCYLDSASVPPVRSRVGVKIFGAGEYFEANATVIYANANLGVGLVFREVKPHYLAVLRKWLLGAMQESQMETQDPEKIEDSVGQSEDSKS